ncbi:hypothetical protein NHQ30_002655 [Ciborinia camelliae]|nr:hypothetical protein NHQ30_002655 [Ciborinia camelliae]
MSTEQQKRLQCSLNTKSGRFSEVTALSQKAINRALGQLVTNFPEITQVQAELAGVSRIQATVGQPEISIDTKDNNRSLVEYYCRLKSGTWENFIDGSTVDVKGWTIAFDVEIGQVVIDPDSDEDKRVRGAIQQPGDYSISSFEASSDFNGVELTTDQKLYLTVLLAKWYATDPGSAMSDRQKRTIAYGLVTGKPQTVNGDAPTFPPTSLKFQTYPYIAPGQTEPQQGIGKGDNNMLIYLQMTDHQSLPKDLLEYSGNFVSSGMDGTICLGRDIFWDKYLLRSSTPRLLPTFNDYTYAWVSNYSIPSNMVCSWNIGMAPGHVSDQSVYNWNANSSNPLEWSWNPSRSEQAVHDIHKEDGWLKLDIDCSTSNTMKALAGTNKVDLSGKTNILVKCQSVGTIYPMNWEYDYTIHIWVTWTTHMTIDAVPGGGLKISLNLPDDISKSFKVDWDPLQFKGSAGWSEISSDAQKSLQNSLIKSVQNIKFGDAQQALQNELDNAARFVAPGGGTFTYKNPQFNNNGDLMIEASYQE